MKWKIVTLHPVELSCPVKIKQPSKLVQEVREIPRWWYLAGRAAARADLSKSDHVLLTLKLKSTLNPRRFYLTLLLFDLITYLLPLSLPIHTGSLPFLKYSKDAPISGLCGGSSSAWTILPLYHCVVHVVPSIRSLLERYFRSWPFPDQPNSKTHPLSFITLLITWLIFLHSRNQVT